MQSVYLFCWRIIPPQKNKGKKKRVSYPFNSLVWIQKKYIVICWYISFCYWKKKASFVENAFKFTTKDPRACSKDPQASKCWREIAEDEQSNACYGVVRNCLDDSRGMNYVSSVIFTKLFIAKILRCQLLQDNDKESTFKVNICSHSFASGGMGVP